MSNKYSVALVTGANRGLGAAFAAALRDEGVKVYAAARDPASVKLTGVIPILTVLPARTFVRNGSGQPPGRSPSSPAMNPITLSGMS